MHKDRQVVMDLLKQYEHLEKQKLATLKQLDEALDTLTLGMLGICIPDPLPVHIYTGLADNIDAVRELADDCKLNCTTVFKDGRRYYEFTVDGVKCIAIGK